MKRRKDHWQEQVRKIIQPELLRHQGRRRQRRRQPAIVLQQAIAVMDLEIVALVLGIPVPKTAMRAAPVRVPEELVQVDEMPVLKITIPLLVVEPLDRLLPDPALSTKVFWGRKSFS
jgi:hypothetical protein